MITLTKKNISELNAGKEIDSLIAIDVMRFRQLPVNFSPSSCLDDAMDVVEQTLMRLSVPGSLGGERTAYFGMYLSRTQALMYDKTFPIQVYFKWKMDKKVRACAAFADSLPLAVCRASLLALIEGVK